MSTPFELYRLHEVVEKFFPGTGLQERDLVKEIKRGRLVVTKIGNREYVSEAALKDMLVVCQERKRTAKYRSRASAIAKVSARRA